MIIRQPHGPDETKGFKNISYNLVPVEIDESVFVVPYASVPQNYLIHEKCIGKVNNDFIFYNIYITDDYVICFYIEKTKLVKWYDLKQNDTIISKKIINKNFYLIFNDVSLNNSRMFRFKDKNRVNKFWNKLKEIHGNI